MTHMIRGRLPAFRTTLCQAFLRITGSATAWGEKIGQPRTIADRTGRSASGRAVWVGPCTSASPVKERFCKDRQGRFGSYKYCFYLHIEHVMSIIIPLHSDSRKSYSLLHMFLFHRNKVQIKTIVWNFQLFDILKASLLQHGNGSLSAPHHAQPTTAVDHGNLHTMH